MIPLLKQEIVNMPALRRVPKIPVAYCCLVMSRRVVHFV